MVAVQTCVRMQGERDVAEPAAARTPQARQWIAGARPRRLRSRIALPPCSRSGRAARRAAARRAGSLPRAAGRRSGHRKRCSQPLAELEPLEPLPALRARRRAPVDRDRVLERGALGRDGARVVARVGLLLVPRSRAPRRRRSGRVAAPARTRRSAPDHDRRLAGRDPLPLVPSLRVGQPRVEDRDPVAEAGLEAAEGLRGERDLRDEDDRASPALERRRAGLKVDLGLAAPVAPARSRCARAFVEAVTIRSTARRCDWVSRSGSASPLSPGRSGVALRAARAASARRARAPVPASSRSSRRPRAPGRRASAAARRGPIRPARPRFPAERQRRSPRPHRARPRARSGSRRRRLAPSSGS